MTLEQLISFTNRYRLWVLRTYSDYMCRRRHGVQEDPLCNRHLLKLALLERLIVGNERPGGCCGTHQVYIPCWLGRSDYEAMLTEIQKCLPNE